MIAGHTFRDTSSGRVCDCGVRWVNIAATSEAQVGAERQRIWACVFDVSRGGR